jgi:flagellar protein FlaG
MTDQTIQQLSNNAATGSHAALRPAEFAATQSGSNSSETGKSLPVIDEQDMAVLAQQLNIASQSIGRDLRFQVDIESGRSVIQVLDRETGEIIRQIPPEGARTYVSERGDVLLRLYDDLA